MKQRIKKTIKEIGHDKDVCLKESRWCLIKLLNEKDEFRRLIMIKFLAEHLDHLK